MQTFYPSQGFTLYTDFDVALTQPPTFEIRRNSDGALVQEGIAEQDSNAVQRWSAAVVLPQDITEGGYTVEWFGNSTTQNFRNSERFAVGSVRSDYVEIDSLIMQDQPFGDVLMVEDDASASDFVVTVRDTNGTVLMRANNADAIERDGDTFYQVTFSQGLKAGAGNFAAFIIQWDYTLDNIATTEYHFVYVATYKVLMYVNELRRMIDRARIQHKNPGLRYNDVDLVAFLNLGLQTINASPPTQTQYGLASIPDTLYAYVLNAAAVKALDSRYLAEAEAAFNFSGQPVSLDVDRTGFIESARDHYQSALDDLKAVKKGLVMSTGGTTGGSAIVGSSAGVLVLARSANLDLSGTYRTGFSNYFQPGSRAIFYDELLANL